MSDTESSSVEAQEAETELDVEAQAQVEDDQTEGEAEGEAEAEPEDDTEEIDHDGQKFRIPKALKDSFLRQADYTRKTQEVAEERRTVAAERERIAQQAEIHAATMEGRVKLAVLDQQLEQLNTMDWASYAQTYGSDAAIAAMGQANQLKAQRDALANEITAKENDFRLSGERETATALQEADQILSREVQGYGPDMVRQVAEIGQSLGFSGDELRASFLGADGKADVRTFKALHELATLRAENAALKSKQTKAQTAEKVAKVQPAATVNAKSGGYKPGLNDDLPADEWVRRRNAQLAKSTGR